MRPGRFGEQTREKSEFTHPSPEENLIVRKRGEGPSVELSEERVSGSADSAFRRERDDEAVFGKDVSRCGWTR